jgi:hypothetical protein
MSSTAENIFSNPHRKQQTCDEGQKLFLEKAFLLQKHCRTKILSTDPKVTDSKTDITNPNVNHVPQRSTSWVGANVLPLPESPCEREA